MAPTREELLNYLRQAQAANPQMTKEELTARALEHFTAQQQKIEETADIILPARPIMISSEQFDAPAGTPAPEVYPASAAEAEYRSLFMSIAGRRIRASLLAIAGFCLVVLLGTVLLVCLAPPQPAREDLLAKAAAIQASPPAETGDMLRFGKRFAGNSAYYDKKYRDQILELVGIVEIVERTAEGELQATLMLADPKKNTIFRAQFRFLPEQLEAVNLARGTVAVLKGRYIGQKAAIMQFYPAGIVYNGAQPDS